MHGEQLTVGFVPVARTTFDIPLAQEIAAQARARLAAAGLTVAGPEALVTTLEEAVAAADQLAGRPLDAWVAFQATFADSTMLMTLAGQIGAPLLLWAVPEERSGGRLRLNSLCGINLGAHALKRAGHAYRFVYAAPGDDAALEAVRTLARAGRARRLLSRARIGRIGPPPDGFETCQVDLPALEQRLGVTVVPVALEQVFERVRTADGERIDALEAWAGERLAGLEDLDRGAVRGTLGTYAALREMAGQDRYDGLAVRCWPQFFTDLGCAACGALAMLNEDRLPAACEADVNGAITQLILQWVSDSPAFDADLVAVDAEADAAVLWHCGKAPLSMADPAFRPRGTIHSNRRLPLLLEFPLKPGRVTVARLSQAGDDLRLVIGGGEMLPAAPSFSGTSGLLRFDRPAQDVLATILSEGLEHHLALTYGEHRPALTALAGMLGLPTLCL